MILNYDIVTIQKNTIITFQPIKTDTFDEFKFNQVADRLISGLLFLTFSETVTFTFVAIPISIIATSVLSVLIQS